MLAFINLIRSFYENRVQILTTQNSLTPLLFLGEAQFMLKTDCGEQETKKRKWINIFLWTIFERKKFISWPIIFISKHSMVSLVADYLCKKQRNVVTINNALCFVINEWIWEGITCAHYKWCVKCGPCRSVCGFVWNSLFQGLLLCDTSHKTHLHQFRSV